MPNECLTWHQARPPSGVMTGWGLCVRRNDSDEHRAKSLPRARGRWQPQADGRGYDLIDKFTPYTEFEEGWSGDYRGECSREIIPLK